MAPSPGRPSCLMIRHHCHIVACDRRADHVLAGESCGRWILPSVTVNVGQSLLATVARALARLGIRGNIVHEARMADGWQPDRLHSYCAVVMEASRRNATLRAIPSLDPTQAVWTVQSTAVNLVRTRLQSPSAPFDDVNEHVRAMEWMGAQIRIPDPDPGATTAHRRSRFHAVTSVRTPRGDVYFKAGPGRVNAEAGLTQVLRRLLPEVFAETLAHDPEREWWLYAGVPGFPLSESFTEQDGLLAVRTLARTQIRVCGERAMAAQLKGRELTGRILFARANETVAQLSRKTPARSKAVDRGPSDAAVLWSSIKEDVARCCDSLDVLQLPPTWVPSDFWSANILRDHSATRLIDVEDSYLGPAPLAVWRFLTDIDRHFRHDRGVRERMENAFKDEWRRMLDSTTLQAAFGLLPIVARLFGLVIFETGTHRLEQEMEAPLTVARRTQIFLPLLEGMREAVEARRQAGQRFHTTNAPDRRRGRTISTPQ
jgi:hypothetical protein